ncbi:TadE family protein [Chelatococcus albus]|nr:TadE/TadG family type IV pilus assembly protein [Chelatococcus sp. SYSU_G07232]
MMQRLIARTEGAAAIEFAFVAPAFVLILCGLLFYGLYFGVAHGVQQLAAEAARASVAGMSASERSTLARQQVMATIGSYPFLKADHVTVDAAPDPADPNRFAVTVRYDASHLGLAGFGGILPIPSDQIVKTAVVRRGGF